MARAFLEGGTKMRTDDGRIHTIAATQHNLSSNGNTIYTLIKWSNGELSCNCAGWATRKACKHTKAAAANGGRNLVAGGTVAPPTTQVQAAATASQPQGRRVVHVKS